MSDFCEKDVLFFADLDTEARRLFVNQRAIDLLLQRKAEQDELNKLRVATGGYCYIVDQDDGAVVGYFGQEHLGETYRCQIESPGWPRLQDAEHTLVSIWSDTNNRGRLSYQEMEIILTNGNPAPIHVIS
jgi:hypothetical protein